MRLCFLSGLREIVGQEEVEIEFTGRLSDLLNTLCSMHDERLRILLLDSESPGKKSPFVKILVDGEDVGQSDPELAGGENIFLFLPIAGG